MTDLNEEGVNFDGSPLGGKQTSRMVNIASERKFRLDASVQSKDSLAT